MNYTVIMTQTNHKTDQLITQFTTVDLPFAILKLEQCKTWNHLNNDSKDKNIYCTIYDENQNVVASYTEDQEK